MTRFRTQLNRSVTHLRPRKSLKYQYIFEYRPVSFYAVYYCTDALCIKDGVKIEEGYAVMTHEEYKVAANHWDQKDTTSEKMPKAQIWEEIEKYIQSNNTCPLATGYGDFIRCTPIEYSWYNDVFWMFLEGGQQLCRCIMGA